MLAKERQSKIVELTRKFGSVEVDKLAEELKVSTMTIRRDLIKLEEENQIKRCHGGAVITEEITYENKQSANNYEKKVIAKKCKTLVSVGSTVFLDAGTTTFEIAQEIKNIPEILIITTDLRIASYLSDEGAKVIICGGTIQKNTGYVYGYYAIQMIKDIRFDIGFFGVAIIDNDFQVLTPTEDKIFIKREAKNQCDKTYVVADQSKFEKKSAVKVNNLSEYTGIITTKKFNKTENNKIIKSGISIINAE